MKPILFNTDMVQAIQEGYKTVTRRVIKYSCLAKHRRTLDDFIGEGDPQLLAGCSPYQAGDILWVRETWAHPSTAEIAAGADPDMYLYKADSMQPAAWDKWRPSIHMPKEAARLFLRVTGVRVERLQDITKSDALREGVRPRWSSGGCRCASYVEGCMGEPCPNRDAYEYLCHVEPFVKLWDTTLKPNRLPRYGWAANPWVWVIAFERISKEAALGGVGDG